LPDLFLLKLLQSGLVVCWLVDVLVAHCVAYLIIRD
jgi:hypothetical protein